MTNEDQPPVSESVANSWQEFEGIVFPAIAADLCPTTFGVSQLGFYFGALTTLDAVQAVMHGAESGGALAIALDGPRDEVEGFIPASGERVN